MYMNFDEKHSSNVLENQTRLQNSAYTTKTSRIFCVCGLFEKIPFTINRDILKNPTWWWAKNSNELCAFSHLVTWIPHTAICNIGLNSKCKLKVWPSIFTIDILRQTGMNNQCRPWCDVTSFIRPRDAVGCSSDWWSGGRGFDPHGLDNFFSWRLIMKYFLRSVSPFRWFRKGSC